MAGSSKLSFFDFKAFNAHYGGVTKCNYKGNHILYPQGDPAGTMFYIEKGKVKLTVVSEEGKEGIIAVLEAGDFCGEGCLIDQLLRLSTATTLMMPGIAMSPHPKFRGLSRRGAGRTVSA